MEMQRIAIHACEIAVRCLEGLRQDASLISYKDIRKSPKIDVAIEFLRGGFAQRPRETLGLFRQCRFCGMPNNPAPDISRAMRFKLDVSPS
jgi:hypothetical protein